MNNQKIVISHKHTIICQYRSDKPAEEIMLELSQLEENAMIEAIMNTGGGAIKHIEGPFTIESIEPYDSRINDMLDQYDAMEARMKPLAEELQNLNKEKICIDHEPDKAMSLLDTIAELARLRMERNRLGEQIKAAVSPKTPEEAPNAAL